MRSMDEMPGENSGGSGSEPGVPSGGVAARTGPGNGAGGEAPAGGPPHDLTPYLALVISAYGATKSFPATVVAAVIAVIAAIMSRR